MATILAPTPSVEKTPFTGRLPKDYDRIACWLPDADFSIHARWNPDGVENLLYFYDVSESRQHVNIELLPTFNDVAPGERAVLRGTFGVSDVQPKRLP